MEKKNEVFYKKGEIKVDKQNKICYSTKAV